MRALQPWQLSKSPLEHSWLLLLLMVILAMLLQPLLSQRLWLLHRELPGVLVPVPPSQPQL